MMPRDVSKGWLSRHTNFYCPDDLLNTELQHVVGRNDLTVTTEKDNQKDNKARIAIATQFHLHSGNIQ